jgi:uncharacterized protein YjbJ (UPF0337 family)
MKDVDGIVNSGGPWAVLLASKSKSSKGKIMDKDRIEGSVKQLKGAAKEIAGKITGDAKLQSDGKADKAAGKIQNLVGGIKDALRGK